MSEAAVIYRGEVVHRRTRPKQHKLRYRVFSMLVDVDRLEELGRTLRLFSFGRFNLFSIKPEDHGHRDGRSISGFAWDRVRAAGLEDVVKRIDMLAYPRMFGYAFNPITVFYARDAEERVRLIIYEVSNTFGEHHIYQPPAPDPETGTEPIAQRTQKRFFVSPFNTLDGEYRFSVTPPGENVHVGIVLDDGEGPMLTAHFSGVRQPVSDFALVRLALAYPFMTAKVLAGIYWEAFRLWLKGVPPTLHLRRKRHRKNPAPHRLG
ncbi:DUF1365 domain-containing protein [Cucumibacter marinus]|uniref:DUF1365 domain-containing protein n=1 Tax=Cucumibacter marinus TaxID=1121252 RepID=UPI00041ABA32|nr:DUF1365 domain-containing protein [Cucumibacter marinus]